MTKRAQKYDCLTGRIRAIVFCTIGITLLFGWADAYNALATNYLQQNLRENSLNASVKGNKSPLGSLLSFSSLMLSQNLSQESKSPVSSVHISHITSVPPAGERHAFSVWSLQLPVWSVELPVISSGPRPEGEGSREILSCRASRGNSGNKGNGSSFRAQRSGVEKSFLAEPHAETAKTAKTPVISSAAERSREILSRRSIATERKNLSQIAQMTRISSPTTIDFR